MLMLKLQKEYFKKKKKKKKRANADLIDNKAENKLQVSICKVNQKLPNKRKKINRNTKRKDLSKIFLQKKDSKLLTS